MRLSQGCVIGLLVLAACGRRLHVESDTSWSGAIGGDASYSVDGSGDRTFDIDAGTVCWTFQKETERGRLRAYAEEKGIFAASRMGDASTSAAYGLVSGCAE